MQTFYQNILHKRFKYMYSKTIIHEKSNNTKLLKSGSLIRSIFPINKDKQKLENKWNRIFYYLENLKNQILWVSAGKRNDYITLIGYHFLLT